MRPTPSVERVLRETKAALEAAGHKVIEYKPYDVEQANTLLLRLLGADGADGLYNLLRAGEYPEPWPPGFEILEGVYNQYKDKPPKVGALWAAQADRNVYLRQLLKEWADSKEVTGTGRPWDGVIAPTLPNPAHTHYKAHYSGYTSLWNVADFTGVDFPAGVSKSTDTKPADFTPRNDTEKKAWDDCEWYVPGAVLTRRQCRGARWYPHWTAAAYHASHGGVGPQADRGGCGRVGQGQEVVEAIGISRIWAIVSCHVTL